MRCATGQAGGGAGLVGRRGAGITGAFAIGLCQGHGKGHRRVPVHKPKARVSIKSTPHGVKHLASAGNAFPLHPACNRNR